MITRIPTFFCFQKHKEGWEDFFFFWLECFVWKDISSLGARRKTHSSTAAIFTHTQAYFIHGFCTLRIGV